MIELNLYNSGLNAPASEPVSLTATQFLGLLRMCDPLSPQYPVLLKIAASLGLQTGLNIPHFQPDGLGGYVDENDNYYDQAALNGFFSNIGNFVKRNVTSATKDVGRIVGQAVKIAGPIVSAVTGIPVEKIAGFTAGIGNMIGGDLGNMLSATVNGGESVKAQTDRMNREQADADRAAQAEADKAQAAANATAQAQYDAQIKAQQNAQIAAAAAIKARTPIGFVQNPLITTNQPAYTTPIATPAQVATIAAVKDIPKESVAEEVTKLLAKQKKMQNQNQQKQHFSHQQI